MIDKRIAAIVVVSTIVALGFFFTSGGGLAQDPVVYRALILQGNETYDADESEFKSALETPRFGNPAVQWYSSIRLVSMLGSSWVTVRNEIETTFQNADSNDVSLIVVDTSGTKINDGQDQDDNNTNDQTLGRCDTLPCDEAVATFGGIETNDARFKIDDLFDDLFLPFQVGSETRFGGPKIIILPSCYSGGLADGTRDLPVANSVVLMASTTNEVSRGQSPAFQNDNNRAHFWFSGYLIAGLADNGSGKARADTNPQNNEVTVKELFDYASPKVIAADSRQHPQKNYTQGSDGWIVLKYNDSTSQNPTLIQHSETKWTESATNRQKCIDDGGGVGGIIELPEIAANNKALSTLVPNNQQTETSDKADLSWLIPVLAALGLAGIVGYSVLRLYIYTRR